MCACTSGQLCFYVTLFHNQAFCITWVLSRRLSSDQYTTFVSDAVGAVWMQERFIEGLSVISTGFVQVSYRFSTQVVLI